MKNHKKMLWFTDRLVFLDTDFTTDKRCPLCNGQGEVDEIDQSRVTSQTIDPPYHKVTCNECEGVGYLTEEEL